MWLTSFLLTAWASGWPDLAAPAPALELGARDAAVVVGIEDYFFLEDVEGALLNATDWYGWLVESRGIPMSKVRIMRNEHAVRETILEEAAWAAEAVGDGGTVWFVYIGHGAPDRDGQDGLLVGADAQQNARSLYARGLPQGELLASLEGGEQANTVVVLDACFSGQSPGGRLVEGLQPMIPTYAMATGSKATILSAGKSDQFAGPLPGGGRPAFSYLALGALRGWGDADGDGIVSASEAVEYSQGTLTALLDDRRQTPQLHGEGDVPLGGGEEAGPNVMAMVRARSETTESTPAKPEPTPPEPEPEPEPTPPEPTPSAQEPTASTEPASASEPPPEQELYGMPVVTPRDGEVTPLAGDWVEHRDEARAFLEALSTGEERLSAIRAPVNRLVDLKAFKKRFGKPDLKVGSYWYYGDSLKSVDSTLAYFGGRTAAVDTRPIRDTFRPLTVRGEPGLYRLLGPGTADLALLAILRATPEEVADLLGPPEYSSGNVWSYTGVQITFGLSPDGPVVAALDLR